MWAQNDGLSGWRNRYPSDYHRTDLFPDNSAGYCDNSGTGYTYGWSAGFGNVAIKGQTGHSTAACQCIYFGAQTRNDALACNYLSDETLVQ